MNQSVILTLITCLAAFLLTAALLIPYRWLAPRIGMIDKPNARSAHQVPTPRGAGTIFVLLWLVFAGILYWYEQIPYLVMLAIITGAVLTAVVGFVDDMRPLPALWRATIHLLAAGWFAYVVFGGQLPWYGTALIALAVAWSLNLFNFMDGTDGFAGSEAIFVLGLGGFFCWQSNGTSLAIIIWILTAACGGFLLWNWPKAKVFMGDVASGFLGFVIAAFALVSYLLYDVPLVLWLILYGVFWFDASVTLVRRLLRKEKWYAAHRSHAYQRLYHQAGVSHRQLLYGSIAMNTVLAGLALWGFTKPESLPLVFVISLLVLIVIYGVIEKYAPMQSRNA